MRKRKIKEKYIRALFTTVEEQEAQQLRQNGHHDFNSFATQDVYLLNEKYYRVKSEDGAGMRKTLLRCLYKHNFYVPKKIRRIIFKKFLLQNETADVHNFNYDVYLLLSYLKNPNVHEATQKIIDLDVFRTRINKENEKTIYFFNLFLNYACNHFQFKYKQGLNEVLALFFYLKGKYFNLVDVYFCFQSFVERFLKEFYYDDEFFFLQISFYLFKILIKYHDPVLSEVLETNKMSPEIYAASWFLTLFASKSNLEISNAIYLIFLLERNPFFYFFFSLALLILHRNIFLCVDSSNLPELLSKINIFNKKFLKKVWSLGKFLEANTPVSFVHKLFFIKNVLMYLTDEHPADSQQKKDILLEFFNSIDYMSVNAFEIIKNISLGKHKYIFLDIRSRRHFRTFHLKSSISVELVEGYADILRGQIDSQDRRRKRKKERKKQWKAERKNARNTQLQTEPRKQWKAEPGGVPPPIAHILKRFGSREVARNAGLLFSHLLREKYSQRSRLSYDDNVMLTRVVSAGARRGSPLDFSALGRSSGRRRRRRAKQLGREKQMEKANHMGRANQMGRAKGRQEEAFPNLHLLRGERNAEVDLNAFICSAYARRRPPRGEARRGKMKGKPYEHVNMKYVEERKAKSRKRYHSDDDVVARPFGLACHRMKGAFLARLEGEQVSGQVSGKVGVKVNSQPNRQNHSKCLPSEPPPCAAAPAQSQNTSSFNLYVLIKEKVLCDEDCLRFLFEDVLTPEKQVIILYDDKWDNAKYVRGFYYELLFNTKLRQVAIIEGGINSYHSLMRLDLFERKVSSLVPSFISTAGGTNKERSPHGDEAPQLYTPQCLLGRNKKTMKKFFHPNHSCYLCDYRHFRKTKKKLLDDCFFESYSNFTIFELFFCFLGGEREDVSFASFYEQIAWVKSRQGGVAELAVAVVLAVVVALALTVAALPTWEGHTTGRRTARKALRLPFRGY